MRIEWSRDYELGIKTIDDQHKRLLAIINSLDEAYRGTKYQERTDTIFLQLINYCNYHFTVEEMAMEKSHYHRLELHKTAHDLFINRIQEYFSKHKKEDCFALPNTIDFLLDWLIDHILVEDRNYVPIISDKFK